MGKEPRPNKGVTMPRMGLDQTHSPSIGMSIRHRQPQATTWGLALGSFLQHNQQEAKDGGEGMRG